MKELTPKMQDAIDFMKRHENKMVRFPGGYWSFKGWSMWQGQTFGTPTIQALVARGIAEYTLWKDSRRSGVNHKFPIEVSLKETST